LRRIYKCASLFSPARSGIARLASGSFYETIFLQTFCEFIKSGEEDKTMPKLKSNRGAAKRLKATGTGKIKHYKAFGSHLLTHKTTKQKRNLRGSEVLNKRDTKNMKRLLPYL
jgi:large subunit ribosomal protein L35